jgi:hypothetical protein
MRFINSLILGLIVLLLMVGCFAGGGGGSTHAGTEYDGSWTVSYANSAFVKPTSGTNQIVVCDKPPVTMTLSNGAGSVTQNNTCWAVYSASASAAAGTTPGATVPGSTEVFYDQIGVFIKGTMAGDILTAQVNSATMTGTCTYNSCAAQTSTGGLSMIR